MSSEAFYKLMDVLNKRDTIDALIKKHTLQEILFAFKANGLGVNAYPDSNSYEEYLELISEIYSTDLTQKELAEIKNYERDINAFNALFKDYYNKNEFNEVIQVPDKNKLFAFLITFEIYIRALKDKRFNGGKNRDFYVDVNIQQNIKGKVTGIDQLSTNQLIDAIDYILQQASKVVQAFIFNGYLYDNKKFNCSGIEEEIEWDDVKRSIQYFQLIDIRNVLFDALEDWKFGNYELKCNGQYTDIIPKDVKSFLDEKIEIQRFESQRQTNVSIEDENELITQFSSTNSLAPDAFMDKMEKSSYEEYLEYFSSDNLDYKVNGIELVKWLRAYAIVRYYNIEFLDGNIFPDNAIPNKWLYITTRDQWINMFIKHGIDKKSAEIIYSKLLFKKTSIDWLDSPFIEIGDNVITVPSLASSIQDVIALTSMATKENMNLDFKGYCYEDRILNDLRNNQIPAVSSIKRKIGNEVYECDIAFLLGNDLFLCECKHTSQPVTQRKRFDFYNKKIPEDVKQTNRICDFYSSNLIHVINEFNKNQECNLATDWKPRRIYRMVIYSCKLAGKLEMDRVIITDYTIFKTILYKQLPTIFKNSEPAMQIVPPNMKGVFQGNLTTNKLLNFIESPWQIGIQKAITEIEEEVISINSLFLRKKRAFRTMDNFYDLGK